MSPDAGPSVPHRGINSDAQVHALEDDTQTVATAEQEIDPLANVPAADPSLPEMVDLTSVEDQSASSKSVYNRCDYTLQYITL